MSLLEVLTATTLMATMMASTVIVLRGSYAAWQAHESDLERYESAYAVLRHVIRHVRQADQVVAANTPGALSLSISPFTSDNWVWEHNGATGEVMFGENTADSLLADNINSLTFETFKADGVTPTVESQQMQLIRCTATVTEPIAGGPTREVSCTGWIRSWTAN